MVGATTERIEHDPNIILMVQKMTLTSEMIESSIGMTILMHSKKSIHLTELFTQKRHQRASYKSNL